MINKSLYTSNKDDWETPQDLFDKLDLEFKFDLDVCANEKNAKCEKFFSIEKDGLKQDWIGTCWCNPPYGRQIGKWIKKARDESRKGALVVMLLPSRTDTKYFHDYIYHRAEIRFLKGRLKFSNSKNSAPFPSVIVIFRP